MEVFIVLVLVVLIGMLVNRYMNLRSIVIGVSNERKQAMNDETFAEKANLLNQAKAELESISKNMDNNDVEEKGTRDLFLETLTKIGCQYEIGEDETADITFGYQGEGFIVRANNSCNYINIYDTYWLYVELYDIDEFARLKKAINESNLRDSVITSYTIDEAGGNVHVHTKSSILFIPEIPNIEGYLKYELYKFFKAHETVHIEMAKQREKEVGEKA